MGLGVGPREIRLSRLRSGVLPREDNVFDLGGIGRRWRDCRIGRNMIIDGNLTVNGVTTTINSVTITVDDKNIELAVTEAPTDDLANGGGIRLRGTTDKTILYNKNTDSWDFNKLVVLEKQIQIKEGSPGVDKILTSDANGLAAWEIPPAIYAQLSSSVDQEPADTNPTVITYNIQDAINGITHSTTVDSGEITIVKAGIYFVCPQPQVGKDSGGVKVDFDMFLQVDRGAGFVDEVNSNIKLTIKDSDITDVIIVGFSVSLDVGDVIRLMQRVSDAAVGMGLKNTDPVVGPPTIPRTPSIIFTMFRVGGLAA